MYVAVLKFYAWTRTQMLFRQHTGKSAKSLTKQQLATEPMEIK